MRLTTARQNDNTEDAKDADDGQEPSVGDTFPQPIGRGNGRRIVDVSALGAFMIVTAECE
ncbi:MAG: hypothetical protein A2341_01360 [Deltaproteobacteria bacterium RIFOXYB12_FULL_58_9]|nr:MAG: hypothetical protein A2341_01360 [Deltaproteobacteria bacterium RIFOXYB12_FULL_58_9]